MSISSVTPYLPLVTPSTTDLASPSFKNQSLKDVVLKALLGPSILTKVMVPVCANKDLEELIQNKESLGTAICKVLKIALAIIFFPIGIIWAASYLFSKEEVVEEVPVIVIEEKKGLDWVVQQIKSSASSCYNMAKEHRGQLATVSALTTGCIAAYYLGYFSQEPELPVSSEGWSYTTGGLTIAAAIVVLAVAARCCSARRKKPITWSETNNPLVDMRYEEDSDETGRTGKWCSKDAMKNRLSNLSMPGIFSTCGSKVSSLIAGSNGEKLRDLEARVAALEEIIRPAESDELYDPELEADDQY